MKKMHVNYIITMCINLYYMLYRGFYLTILKYFMLEML